ncbi:polyketide synthase [Cordyceps fumosorosea ARSEF 2679]|uniref:Polyketide synthase n=1 Tax=Cordyceps fumosorosea (strain ARSEF 2679) TaxID=1081104 RepID=A0A168E5I1_CORFA|nr:polyketide synthase [Cordyceps fumosorosea ARSEF 2679]OAA73400.1 polyketide synthase [Cordyceps fumosorosea ARSEF 2679]
MQIQPQVEPVAIVGMGFGDYRYSQYGFIHPDAEPTGITSTQGGFLLKEDPRLFDHTCFGT